TRSTPSAPATRSPPGSSTRSRPRACSARSSAAHSRRSPATSSPTCCAAPAPWRRSPSPVPVPTRRGATSSADPVAGTRAGPPTPTTLTTPSSPSTSPTAPHSPDPPHHDPRRPFMTQSTPAAQKDGYRIEHDTMGEGRVPASALYRAQTQRAVQNFPISGQRLEPANIHARTQVKKAAARANKELGVLEGEIADAIVAAADAVIAGDHDYQFPVDTYQTGSGTSSNMNMNEVLATLATNS